MKYLKILFPAVAVIIVMMMGVAGCTKDPVPHGGTDTIDTTDTRDSVAINEYGPSHDTVFEVEGIRFYMKYVPAGSFYMGASSVSGSRHYDAEADDDVEAPVHHVNLSGYLMAEVEVSQALYFAVMGSNPSPDNDVNLPVRAVSYTNVQVFLSALSKKAGYRFRLPTEAEWEYAARGAGADSASAYSFSGSSTADAVAWYKENAGDMPHYLGMKQANTLGIYDLTGNVAEWCSDWYDNYSSDSQSNPQGPNMPVVVSRQRHVVRGGAFNSERYYIRNTYRAQQFASYEGNDVGIRLVMSVK
jgi:formylglycine-generating enzyme required for sulfatase activity